MKYIMCSRHFPKGHPKAAQPTYFVEKIWNGFRDETFSLPDNFDIWTTNYVGLLKGDYLNSMDVREIKHHTIRPGSRFKPGDMVSLRVWSDKPYRSKQIEFAQVEVKKVRGIEIKIINGVIGITVDGKTMMGVAGPRIAKNDGLEWLDFVNWFNIHPKKKGQVFRGQIISWSDLIDYTGHPDLKTIKAEV